VVNVLHRAATTKLHAYPQLVSPSSNSHTATVFTALNTDVNNKLATNTEYESQVYSNRHKASYETTDRSEQYVELSTAIVFVRKYLK